MNIHEFQGKELFRRYGIPVPKGRSVHSADDAYQAGSELGGKVVVKAQIHAGGRGKGTLVERPDVRGVKVCNTADEAKVHADDLIGSELRTHQTGPEGQPIKQVLVEEASDIASELYAGLTLDRDSGRVTFIVSTEGGVEIEEVAANSPEKIIKQAVDPATGLMPHHTRRLAFGLGFAGAQAKQAMKLFANLYALYTELDASLVEINPLVITGAGELIALDAKVNFDNNGLFRHDDIRALRDEDEEDPKERQANDAGLSYVALDGNIGCLVNGAGLAMATMDIIKYSGGDPANFLDVGGGATAEQVTTAFKIILEDPNVKAILVNIFGGIARCDVIAEGIVTAARELGLKVPLVVRLEGTNVEQGKQILNDSGLSIIAADDMLDGAKKVVDAAGVE